MVDTVTINKAAEQAEPSLEDQARAMGIDPTEVDSTATAQEAPKILGKFKSQEELEKAYRALEKKLGSGEKIEPDEPAEPDLPSDADNPVDETEQDEEDQGSDPDDKSEAEKELENRGLDFTEFSAEYNEKGELSEAAYEKLEKAGIPKDTVDEYIRGQEAIRELTRQAVFTEAGGEKTYWAMTDWAAKSLSEAEIDNFNSAVEGPDRVAAAMAVKGLRARYEAERGREPARTLEGRPSRANTSRYESVAQMQKDMADPRYHKDAAYRAKVEAKLARSNIL